MTDQDQQPRTPHGGMVWPEQIPDDQWAVYQQVIAAAQEQGLPFALGGAFALATYTGNWRNTKDLDLFILPETKDTMVDLLNGLGMNDYYDELAYDRGWIYRAYTNDIIIDAIWCMANRRAFVGEEWLARGPEVVIRGEKVRILPVEQVIWNKIYIVHRDRCDWGDVLNMIYTAGPTMDWEYLLGHLEEDVPLLSAVMSVFTWLCPGRAAALPSSLWQRLHLPVPEAGAVQDCDRQRADFLDARPWFYPLVTEDEACQP